VNGSELTDDLDVVAHAVIVTSRYAGFRPEFGVPVRITVGQPKFWRRAQPADGRLLAPWGLLDPSIPTDECRRRYGEMLDGKADRIIALLARLARAHPNQRLVLLCFENVHAGQECHRRWFAAWFEEHYGIAIPELEAPDGQQRLPL
jgi:hypothetical protein